MDVNKIYNEDCLVTMDGLADKCIDLIITSPPYGEIRDYKGFRYDFKRTADGLVRILKPGGVLVWVIGDQVINGGKSGESFRNVLYYMDSGLLLYDTIIYKKPGVSYPSPGRYYNVFEYMFILSKGKPKTLNLLRDRVNKQEGKRASGLCRYKDGGFRPYKSDYVSGEYGVRTNIWEYFTGHKDPWSVEHPAVFPEKLAVDHIVTWSNPGDVVYDPFMGAGTTAKACIITQRKYIGSEVSRDYCEIIKKRTNFPLFSIMGEE